jgi:MFS transporter, DHA1 family, inner membrane transport protein
MSTISRGNAALAALGVAAFVFGTAEFVIVGVLDLVARDLHVSVGTAGQLVMAYALGISIGGPVVTAATSRMDRRTLLLAALIIFILANLVMTVARDLGVLLLARFIPGAMHGLFVGVASIAAAQLVPPGQQGAAMSKVFGGVAVATVLGVPVGTFVAQALGWRIAFVGIIALSVIALVGVYASIPASGRRESGSLREQARSALAPRVLAMLGIGMILIGGQFTAFTYMAPYLAEVTGVSGRMLSAFLFAYGAASAIGMFVGGGLADRNAPRTLIVANVLLIVTLGALYLFGSIPAFTAVALGTWGLVAFGLIPSLQFRVVGLAGPGADLAATLSASAVNAGIAAGSVIGGWVLTRYGADSVVLLATALCAAALPGTVATRYLRPPRTSAPEVSGNLVSAEGN